MKVQSGEPFLTQYEDAVKSPFCNPLGVAETSDSKDLFVDTGCSKLIDSSACFAINGVVTGVTMLSAIPVVAVGLAAKALSSPRWATKALSVPAVPVGLLLGSCSAVLHLTTGGVMTVIGIGGVLCGAGFFPVELAHREIQRLAEVPRDLA